MTCLVVRVQALLVSLAIHSSAQATGPFEIRLADGQQNHLSQHGAVQWRHGPFEIRLADGQHGAHEGRLEVYYQGEWDMVTDTGWGVVEAGVVCRQLGYRASFPAAVGLQFGIGLTKSVLDKVKCHGNESRLDECDNLGWNACSSSCTSDKDVGVRCLKEPMPAPPYQLRLALGPSPFEGLVEVAYNEQWGPLCAAGFSYSSAVTVCRQLGFGPPKHRQALSAPDDEEFRNKLVLSSRCAGQERSLLDCELNADVQGSCLEDDLAAYVSCNSPTDPYPLVLDSTSHQHEGTVQIYAGGQFGTVCGSGGWDQRAASVACKQLGYGPAVEHHGNSRFGPGSQAVPVHLSSLRCTGFESVLAECSHGRFGAANCTRQQLASVICHKRPLQDYSLRIAGGHAYQGTLEVAYGGRWMAICPADWDLPAAGVACRQMGLGRAVSADAAFPSVVKTALWSRVVCGGDEESLDRCNASRPGQYRCPDGVLATVACGLAGGASSRQKPVGIRLAGGLLPYEGAVQVQKNGTWRAVCNTSWDAEDESVACHQLGFHGAAGGLVFDAAGPDGSGGGSGGSGGSAYMNEVACKGTESALTSCRHSHLGHGAGCPSGAGLAGVLCNPFNTSAQPSGVTPLRLVGGSRPSEGRVEVFFNDSWGGVCGGSAWTLATASVACRQLGYESATGMHSQRLRPSTAKRSLLADVDCAGTELMLSACGHGLWKTGECPGDDTASVVCKYDSVVKRVNPYIPIAIIAVVVLIAVGLVGRRALRQRCRLRPAQHHHRLNVVQVPPDVDGTGAETNEGIETKID